MKKCRQCGVELEQEAYLCSKCISGTYQNDIIKYAMITTLIISFTLIIIYLK